MTIPIYTTGTVSVSANGTVVTGDGSQLWLSNVAEGDWISIGGQPVVMVTNVVDNSHLNILPWPYAAQAMAAYVVVENFSSRDDATAIARSVANLVAAQNKEGFIWFVGSDETEPDKSRGDEGQFGYQPSTGKQWYKEGGEWVYDGTFKPFGIPAPYDPAKTYNLQEVATDDGTSYVWINPVASSGHAPPDATYWSILAGKGDKGDKGDPGPTGSVDPTIAYAYLLGMRGDGTTDNAAIFAAWVAGLPAGGGKLVCGPGKFLSSAVISKTFSPSATGPSNNKNTISRITIEGAGDDLTELYFPGSDGLDFELSSFQHAVTLTGFSLTTGAAGGHTAVKLHNTFPYFGEYNARHLIDITIRGADGYAASDYWGTAIDCFNVSNISFGKSNLFGPVASTSDNTKGTGIRLVSSATPGGGTSTEPGYGTSYDLTGVKIRFMGRALEIGTGIQGVVLGSSTEILNGYDGVYILAGSTEVRQLTIDGAQISVNGDAVYFGSAVPASVITGSYIGVATGKNGLVFATNTGAANSSPTIVSGNTISGRDTGAGDAIYVNSNYGPIVITGNGILGVTTGVECTANSSKVTVQDNSYMNCTNDVLDSGTGNIIGDGAWRAYTPSVTANSGSFTTVSATGRYKRIGKTVFISVVVTITTNGTAAGNIQVSVPLPFLSTTAMLARENAVTGFGCSSVGAASTIYVTKYDGSYLGANGYAFSISGSYETS